MREILFRGKTEPRIKESDGRWVEGSLILVNKYCCILEKELDEFSKPYLDADLGTIDGLATPIRQETVGQFTGLYDNTKWVDLTETEKKRFYHSVYTEDGVNIRYPTVESVKNLWKGKKIFDGDVLSVTVNEMYKPDMVELADLIEMGIYTEDDVRRAKKPTGNKTQTVWTVEFKDHFSLGVGFYLYGKDRRFNLKLSKSTLLNVNAKVIGNVHDNPELLQKEG